MNSFKRHLLKEAKQKLAQTSALGTKVFKSGNNIILVNPTGQEVTTTYK